MTISSKGTGAAKGTGAEFLVRKSDLAKSRKELVAFKDILIIEDEALDAKRLIATLRTMFGYELQVRRASTLSSAVDMLLERLPELVLLDDVLKPSDSAVDSLPMIRRANFKGPIVVISGELTRDRRATLIAKGANETIHKDDLNSVAIADVLTRLGSDVQLASASTGLAAE